MNKVGPTNAVSLFSTCAFCCRIQNLAFQILLTQFIHDFGILDTVLLFQKDSFCTHVENDQFVKTLTVLKQKYGNHALIRLFRNNGLNRNVNDDSYFSNLCSFLDEYGEEALTLFSNNKFGARFNEDKFLLCVQADMSKYDQITFQRLYRNEDYVKQVDNPNFIKTVQKLYEHYPNFPIVNFLINSSFTRYIEHADRMIEAWNSIISQSECKELSNAVTLFECNAFCTKVLKNASVNNLVQDMLQTKTNDDAQNTELMCKNKSNFNIFFGVLAKKYGMGIAVKLCSTSTFINPLLDNFQKTTEKFDKLKTICGESNALKLFNCSAFVTRFVNVKHLDFYEFFIVQLHQFPLCETMIDFFADESFCTQTSDYTKDKTMSENKDKQAYAITLLETMLLLSKTNHALLTMFLELCHTASTKYQKNVLFPSLQACDCKLCCVCSSNVKKQETVIERTKFHTNVCECATCFSRNKEQILKLRRYNYLLSLATIVHKV